MVACDDRVDLQLGSTKYVAKEVAPVRVLAYALCASFLDVSADLEVVLDEAACSWN